jgi:hypothetical protein
MTHRFHHEQPTLLLVAGISGSRNSMQRGTTVTEQASFADASVKLRVLFQPCRNQ